ncbi:DUF2811 domain-containing protein [Crocosphaera sp. XPORK-15E]|uniref:DUF2811 domain-containing protein n=1 Tax=Crocosphaera sp. XPORK-15E TaxID=3110247 RepID=UPI002B21DD0E|nr:DUF2811 domain-containing protein [Crocosphaera sp. XPORK-15E]MEA5533778.1 DUF2811 domain-containing protein [Crocosphaera sp. XPORK-15E]
METPIALEIEIPEETYLLLKTFLESHSPLDFNEVVTLAVSHFLTEQKVQSTLSNPLSTHHQKIPRFKTV